MHPITKTNLSNQTKEKMGTFNLIKRGTMAAVLSTALLSVSAQEVTLNPADYTTPTWTQLQRVMAGLKSGKLPYSINMTYNGDPTTRLAFAWFTNPEVKNGKVQIVAKNGDAEPDFANPTKEIEATSADVKDLNYVNDRNGVQGVEPGTKKSYTSHKALATGLTPATTYYFRVGNDEGWSETGSFTTAATAYDAKEGFSFVYITDTQAQDDEMFDVSQKTVHAAMGLVPDASFVLVNGDLVESSGDNNSEWENEQWFATMQDVWMNYPLVVAQGNHDTSANSNWAWHFNTDDSFNATSPVKTAMAGTVYSFVQGDALVMVINYEDWRTEGYFDALADWMRAQVNAHKDVKWRIATFHKNMFTGSRSHQSDADGRAVREHMLPVFDELDIDIALQGHDHIYEVIGPVDNKSMTLVDGAVEHVETVEPGGVRENMTGKAGGVFNVAEGTLYFLNNSAGRKKYEPRDEAEMIEAIGDHGVENYWGLFSGKFGQTGEPTFSDVTVTADTIFVDTYTVDDAGEPSLFDSFKVIKEDNGTVGVNQAQTAAGDVRIYLDDDSRQIVIKGVEPETVEVYATSGAMVKKAAGASTVDCAGLADGIYIVKAVKGKDSYYGKLRIEK